MRLAKKKIPALYGPDIILHMKTLSTFPCRHRHQMSKYGMPENPSYIISCDEFHRVSAELHNL